MFKIQETGKPETAIWLSKPEMLISSDGAGDITISNDANDSEVIRIKITTKDEKVFLTDASFNRPIHINGNIMAEGSRLQLNHQDSIKVGSHQFEVIDAKTVTATLKISDTNNESDKNWKLIGEGNWLDGQSFILKGKKVLGRDKSSDITIPGSHLSRRHAEFTVNSSQVELRDLESANGCYVNDKRVTTATLKDGDRLTFDTLTFRLQAPKSYQETKGTILSDAITDDQIAAYEAQKIKEKEKPKPTSVGNQVTESDLLLAKHQRDQKIAFYFFGCAIIASVLAAAVVMFIL